MIGICLLHVYGFVLFCGGGVVVAIVCVIRGAGRGVCVDNDVVCFVVYEN